MEAVYTALAHNIQQVISQAYAEQPELKAFIVLAALGSVAAATIDPMPPEAQAFDFFVEMTRKMLGTSIDPNKRN